MDEVAVVLVGAFAGDCVGAREGGKEVHWARVMVVVVVVVVVVGCCGGC